MNMEKVRNVVILGGIHGDEMWGIYLVNKWKSNDEEIKSRLMSCPVDLRIANPGIFTFMYWQSI